MRKLCSAGAALFIALFLALALFATGAFAHSAQSSRMSSSATVHAVALVHTRTVRPFGAFRVNSVRAIGARPFGAFRVNRVRAIGVRPFGAFRVNRVRVIGVRPFGAFRVRVARIAPIGLRVRTVGIFRTHRFFRRARVHFAARRVIRVRRYVAVNAISAASSFGNGCCDPCCFGWW